MALKPRIISLKTIILSGGFFRADFGRFFIEPWFSIGGGHVSATDATLDQSFNAGPISKIELYERSTVGHVIGALRGGVTFWPGDAISIGLFGEVGGWATGAPGAGAISSLGDPKPGAMSGFRGAFGVNIAFGLGDFHGMRSAAAARGAAGSPPPHRRRPMSDF